MVITVATDKGGSGKTTIAINLAAMLALSGDNVLVIDADPQASCSVFGNIRSEAGIEPIFSLISKTGPSLGDEIKRLKKLYDAIVIDTGGRDSVETRKALLGSDIVIIPVVPSQLDIAVFESMIRRFEEAKDFNESLQAIVVVSKAAPNPFLDKEVKLAREFVLALEKDGIFLSRGTLFERQIYKKAIFEGMSISEMPDGAKALLDFGVFFEDVLTLGQSLIEGR